MASDHAKGPAADTRSLAARAGVTLLETDQGPAVPLADVRPFLDAVRAARVAIRSAALLEPLTSDLWAASPVMLVEDTPDSDPAAIADRVETALADYAAANSPPEGGGWRFEFRR